jgi:tagatose 1,6-diphosphate aldolase
MACRPDNEPGEFRFLDPGDLTDGELRLVLQERFPGDPSRNYVPEYRFRMVHVGTGAEVGTIKLRVGNAEHVLKFAGHISYVVYPEHRGHRYAAKTTVILLPLAKRHGLDPVWIACNAENTASRRTCEILGAELVEVIPVPPGMDIYDEGERHTCRYCIQP